MCFLWQCVTKMFIMRVCCTFSACTQVGSQCGHSTHSVSHWVANDHSPNAVFMLELLLAIAPAWIALINSVHVILLVEGECNDCNLLDDRCRLGMLVFWCWNCRSIGQFIGRCLVTIRMSRWKQYEHIVIRTNLQLILFCILITGELSQQIDKLMEVYAVQSY